MRKILTCCLLLLSLAGLRSNAEEITEHVFKYSIVKSGVSNTHYNFDKKIGYVYTLGRADLDRQEYVMFDVKPDIDYGLATYANVENLYLKEITIEWGPNPANKGYLFLIAQDQPFSSIDDLYKVADNSDNITATFPLKPNGYTETYTMSEGYKNFGIGLKDADMSFYVKSITFTWSDVNPSDTGDDTPSEPENPGGEKEEDKSVDLVWCFGNQPVDQVDDQAVHLKDNTYQLDITGDLTGAEVAFLRQNIQIDVDCDKHSSATGCYSVQGGKNVSLFHSGSYSISATLKDCEGYASASSAFTAIVRKLPVVITPVEETVSQPWSNTGFMTFDNIVKIDYDGDLEELALHPVVSAAFNGYEPMPTEKPESMTDYEWEVYGNLSDASIPFDGYFDANGIVAELSGNHYNNSLTVAVPCSGVYQLSFDTADEDIELIQEKTYLNLYAGIDNDYVIDAETLCPRINGYATEDSEILYPREYNPVTDEYELAGDLQHAVLEIPGVYDAMIYYNCEWIKADDANAKNVKSNLPMAIIPMGYKVYSHASGIDMRNLALSSLKLSLIIVKNDSFTPVSEEGLSPVQILIRSAKEGTTGVEGCIPNIAVEAEAEYYDINGLRIKPIQMAKGLYIKKQGIVTEKILVN